MLKGYRIMWMYVMFDLPTGTKKERKQASQFRNKLLDHGFNMVQFSVYSRCCSGKELIERISKQLQQEAPDAGDIDILAFTDKQFENIIRLRNKKRKIKEKKLSQLSLF